MTRFHNRRSKHGRKLAEPLGSPLADSAGDESVLALAQTHRDELGGAEGLQLTAERSSQKPDGLGVNIPVTDSIRIALAGPVVGKGRPRFARLRGGGVTAHTPAQTKTYETALKLAAVAAMSGREVLRGPVSLALRVSVQIPASWPAWRKAAALAGQVVPTSKPDADNYLKLSMDALNKIAYMDDAQAVSVSVEKLYAEQPGLVVIVTPLERLGSQDARPR